MYIIVHCKHEGCGINKVFGEETSGTKARQITINPPKIFVFSSRPEAMEFFTDYINDVDVLDHRCKNDKDEINHIDHCICGIIQLDEDQQPILFYNAKNQIFLLEQGPQVFVPPHDLKMNTNNLNLINLLVTKTKTLDDEQKKRYIELGKRCQKHL